jgi:hypothetical protein
MDLAKSKCEHHTPEKNSIYRPAVQLQQMNIRWPRVNSDRSATGTRALSKIEVTAAKGN